jgi:protoporphyrinogen oxidase
VTSENQASSQTSSSKSPKIFTLSGGNSLLIQSLYESLPERVCLREAVIGIEQVMSESPACKGRFLVRGWNTQILTSKVIIATAGPATSKFISTLSPDLAGKFSSMLFVPLSVIHCAVSSSMPWLSKGFGVLFPPGAPRGLLGIMANSVLFPEVAPSKAHLLTVMMRGLAEEDFGGESPESAAVASIKEFLGFGVDKVLLTTRWQRAIPQLSVGSWRLQAAMDECEANFSGLRFIGVDRGGVGVPDRVGMALSAVTSEFQEFVG